MARTKEVFGTDEIAHLWANQATNKVAYARNPQSNHSFRGPVIFSYAEPIAKIVKGKGGNVVLYRAQTWSNTTNKHQSNVRRAVHGNFRMFTVVSIGAGRHGHDYKVDHTDNLNNYAERLATLATRALSARQRRDSYLAEAARVADEANAYASAFGSRRRFVACTVADLPQVKARNAAEAARKARAETARQVKAVKAEIARNAAEAARKVESLAKVPQWLTGDVAEYPRNLSRADTGTDYMRIAGDDIETSQGARVPLPHVARALRLIVPLIDAGRVWTSPPEKTFAIGHYALRSVDATGRVTVGCHEFSNEEVRRIAVLLQTAKIEAADAAEIA